MPTFKAFGPQICNHVHRFVCATSTVKNLTTGDIKSYTYHQCKSCGHIQGQCVNLTPKSAQEDIREHCQAVQLGDKDEVDLDR